MTKPSVYLFTLFDTEKKECGRLFIPFLISFFFFLFMVKGGEKKTPKKQQACEAPASW